MIDRRKFLARLAWLTGGIATLAAAVPFVRYFIPSERARALGSPISVDLTGFSSGEVRAYAWRGQSVLVMRRGPAELAALDLTDDRQLDVDDPADWQPAYIDHRHRGRNPDYVVLLGNCTHLGCVPIHERERAQTLVGRWWPGGFTCPCHGSVYDNAGRVVRGPAPRNLRVPPHYYASPNELVVGVDAPPQPA